MTNQLKGILITALGVLVIVPDSLLIRLIDADTMTMIFWRTTISCAVMALWCTITRGWARLGGAALLFAITEASGSFLFVVALAPKESFSEVAAAR